jgi:hypothetical protein
MSERVPLNLEAGELVIELFQARRWTDHAWTMHAEVISVLESSGFLVMPEYWITLKNGRRGRLDIVAEYGGGGSVGIELDCRRPRLKSVAKLHQFDGYRIIGIRGIEGHEERGIDACVAMRVIRATDQDKADRRIYRPAPEWAPDWKGCP